MNRRSFPSGTAATAKVKALFLHLDSVRGRAVADAWLKSIRIEKDDLDDETRPLPIDSLHDALVAFVELVSRDAIADTWSWLVAPDNLGAWMRVLRGTTAPEGVLAKLDGVDAENDRTTRWETLAAHPGVWRGRVHIAHDPALEEDGLLTIARAAELAAVPALFGFGKGDVVARAVVAPGSSELSQEFEVRWAVPNARRAAPIGGVVAGIAGAIPGIAHPALGALGILGGVAGVTFGVLGGLAWGRERLRRAETRAQVTRVHALERSLLLKEQRERAQVGNLEGTVVAGQFRIRQRMGAGASGVIYEAIRISDGVPVAMKLLRAAAAHDAVASIRLRREAEALGLAWHPNVVEVIDHGHLADGTAYLAMELLRGESLATRLKNREKIEPAALLPIALQISDALVAVHAAGVVHRDLKPSNIFIAFEPGGVEKVKILDFGIARVEWEETRITNMGAPLGTPGYMSPEQETGGEIDARSDIFAFGAVLYECLVGEAPPANPSGLWRAGMAAAARPGPRPDSGIRRAGLQIDPAWQRIIERAMAPSPEDRFQDTRSFAQALRALSEGDAGSAPADGGAQGASGGA